MFCSSSKLSLTCADCKPVTIDETPAPVKVAVNRELARCKADKAKYSGIRCGAIPLGISLPRFKQLVSSRLTEKETKFPKLIKVYEVDLPAPLEGLAWSPTVKFLDDGTAYRLYTIEGSLIAEPYDLVEMLTAKFGEPEEEGFAHIWEKGGTKVRFIKTYGQSLLSYTDDKLIDLCNEKMGDATDSGDYVH